jgi:hypothetical protein
MNSNGAMLNDKEIEEFLEALNRPIQTIIFAKDVLAKPEQKFANASGPSMYSGRFMASR